MLYCMMSAGDNFAMVSGVLLVRACGWPELLARGCWPELLYEVHAFMSRDAGNQRPDA